MKISIFKSAKTGVEQLRFYRVLDYILSMNQFYL